MHFVRKGSYVFVRTHQCVYSCRDFSANAVSVCTEAESEGGGGFPVVYDPVLNQYFVVILGTSNILTSAKN